MLYPPFPQLLKLRGQYEELEEQVEVARKENKHLQGWCDTCLECLALGFSLLSGNVTSIPKVITFFCTTYQLSEYMWQSSLEIKDCFIVHFDHITTFEALYC